jgi:hypothetical protein
VAIVDDVFLALDELGKGVSVVALILGVRFTSFFRMAPNEDKKIRPVPDIL